MRSGAYSSIAFDDSAFVTCLDCDDYDLCVSCHLRLEHGHHPGHTFKPLSNDASFGELVHEICKAGRGMHHYAICDGCDKVSRRLTMFRDNPLNLHSTLWAFATNA